MFRFSNMLWSTKGLPAGWAKSAKPAPRGGECRSSGFGVVGSQSTGRAPERKVISNKLSCEPMAFCPDSFSSNSCTCLTSREMCWSMSLFCSRSWCTRAWASSRAAASAASWSFSK